MSGVPPNAVDVAPARARPIRVSFPSPAPLPLVEKELARGRQRVNTRRGSAPRAAQCFGEGPGHVSTGLRHCLPRRRLLIALTSAPAIRCSSGLESPCRTSDRSAHLRLRRSRLHARHLGCRGRTLPGSGRSSCPCGPTTPRHAPEGGREERKWKPGIQGVNRPLKGGRCGPPRPRLAFRSTGSPDPPTRCWSDSGLFRIAGLDTVVGQLTGRRPR